MPRPRPDHVLETAFAVRHGSPVAGVDEAGRGPWAGPVVAAAVILDPADLPEGLDDSKRLSPARRAAALARIEAQAAVGLGVATVEEIDALNILRATETAMLRALGALPLAPAAVLVDGNRTPSGLMLPCEAVVGGDGRCLSIAAASIVAKVRRDEMMAELARQWSGYGWESNAGYGTAGHRAALDRLGITPAHRRSFAPIHKMLTEDS